MDAKFTRKEACELADLTGAQVDYLAAKEIIIPEKIGSPRRPTVLYTWFQIIELKIVAKLRERNVPTKIIYGFLGYIRFNNYDMTLYGKYLISRISAENRKKSAEAMAYYGVKPEKYYDPKNFSVGTHEEDEHTWFIVFTSDELRAWMNELIENAAYIGFEMISPLGDIISEIKEAAKKHNILDFEKKANVLDVA